MAKDAEPPLGVARSFKRLLGARDGGVALVFALAMPPIALLGVCGLDIYRAQSVRQSLQDALDAATLAAARSGEMTDAGVRRVGLQALRANMAQFPHAAVDETASRTNFDLSADGSVESYASANVDTLAAGAFLGDRLDVTASALVHRSTGRVEIALVIDNTGSMSSRGKLRAAQDAANDLVDRLEDASDRSTTADAVRVSLVPFSMTVRVHGGFSSQANRTGASTMSWLSQSPNHTGSTGSTGLFSTGANRFALLDNMRIGWGGCIESRPYPYDVQDTAPSPGREATMFVPYFSPDTPDEDTFPNDNRWENYARENDYIDESTSVLNGLVSNLLGSISNLVRLESWSRLLKDPSKYTASRVRSGIGVNRGPNQGCALRPLVRLTDDFDEIRAGIDGMVATGNTNVPMGLMWGWHTVSPQAPFADGTDYADRRVRKVVILLTDGDNVNPTESNPDNSSYSGVGLIWQGRLGSDMDVASSSQRRADRMDERLLELCRNMRNQDITLFTVGVQVSNNSQRLLRNCADSDDRFFNVTNTNGIGDAFDQIAGQIESLRIAR